MYDVVVWGATGYSGRLIAKYLAQKGTSVKWAIAGRSSEKLRALRDELGGGMDALQGDASDLRSVDNVVKQARVVVAAAGPFSKMGTPVFQSCLDNNCHYVDINGETPWVRHLLDTYSTHPNAANVTLIPNCGFDCVPSEMGAWYAVQALKKASGNPNTLARSVRGYFDTYGAISGGTLATGIAMEESGYSTLRKLADPYLLGGRPEGGARRAEDAEVKTVSYNAEVGCWTGPFMMAGINTRVVRRSLELLKGELYAKDASYNECAIAKTEKQAMKLMKSAPVAVRKDMVEKGKLPKPGAGASDKMNEKFYFNAHFYGESECGKYKSHVLLSGGGGYTETARMSAEAALLLATQPKGTFKTGIQTPSSALGGRYFDALKASGLQFTDLSAESKL